MMEIPAFTSLLTHRELLCERTSSYSSLSPISVADSLAHLETCPTVLRNRLHGIWRIFLEWR